MRRPLPAALPGALGVLAGILTLSSCTDGAGTSSRSSSLLLIERIEAAAGGTGTGPDPVHTFLESDVQLRGRAFDDVGRVTTRLLLEDPGTADAPTSPTTVNYVTVTRYRVVYRRTDGRSTPGVDVPLPIDGVRTFTAADGIGTADFVLVRAAAKLEPPLRALAGAAGVIHAHAQVTLYGADQAGAAVEASGAIGIDFADWADDGGSLAAAPRPIRQAAAPTRAPGVRFITPTGGGCCYLTAAAGRLTAARAAARSRAAQPGRRCRARDAGQRLLSCS